MHSIAERCALSLVVMVKVASLGGCPLLLLMSSLMLNGIPHNAAAKAQSEAGVTFALFAKGMTALLCRSWALC